MELAKEEVYSIRFQVLKECECLIWEKNRFETLTIILEKKNVYHLNQDRKSQKE